MRQRKQLAIGLFLATLFGSSNFENALWGQSPNQSQEISVTLTPGEPGSKEAPRYSPPGKMIQLTNIPGLPAKELPGHDPMEATISLGEVKEGSRDQRIVVVRSTPGGAYDTLYLDADRNGKLDLTPIKIEPKVTRGKTWSSFEATLKIDNLDSKSPINYPVALWIVVDTVDQSPDGIRLSRRGFVSGKVEIEGTPCEIVLSDSNNDGILKEGDWWELRVDGKVAKGMGSRNVGDFHWANGKAWKLNLKDTAGRSATLVPFDPGMTPEEDELARDPFAADRIAKRAEKPVGFQKDVDEAIAAAIEAKKPFFLKFETVWCGPCKTMNELVFTAQEVVDAATGVVCIKVDGDERKDLVEKHKVTGYPTGVLLNESNEEIARFLGYASVKQTKELFSKVKK